jgi:hypothetical protein
MPARRSTARSARAARYATRGQAELVQEARDEDRRERRRRATKARSAPSAPAPGLAGASMRAAQASASSISSSRCTVRSVMRRTLSISPAGASPAAPTARRWRAARPPGTAPTNRSRSPGRRALGVRDQRDRQLVDARVAGERPARQLRQLAVVAARQLSRTSRMCSCTDVEVVQQPLAAGPTFPVPRYASLALEKAHAPI